MSSKQWSDMSDEQRDEWLASVGMWYVANWDEATDEKGFAKPLGRMLGRGIGGRAPRAGRGGGDIDPLGGRDLEDVVDRNRDGWVFSGRWRRRAAAPKVAGRDESAKPKTPGRALRALPSVDRRARKPKGAPEKVTDVFKPRRQDGLSRVNRRYQAVIGRVMNRFDNQQLILPGSHGERHVAMLEAVDAAPSRAAAKKVIADRINEIDKRIDALNKMLDKRRVNRGAKERHLDEMLSLLKEREWALHRQQQLADLPSERPKSEVTVGALGRNRKIPVSAEVFSQIRAREKDVRARVAEALDSERPDRANNRYLAKIRARYDGDFGSNERIGSIQSELDKANKELTRAEELWTLEPDSELDGSRAATHAARIRMVESIERDLANAQRIYENRQLRKKETGSTPQKFDNIGKIPYDEKYSLPDDLRGLDIEDVYRQEQADRFVMPFYQRSWFISPLDTDTLDARINSLNRAQLRLEQQLRESGLDGGRRYDYEQVLLELDFRRRQRTEGIADRMRYEGAIDNALTKDKEGSPIRDVESLIGFPDTIEGVAFNQRDVDDWDEANLSTPEQVRPEAKRLEGKVVSFEEGGRSRTGIVAEVYPFDEDRAIDSWDQGDELEVSGGSIVIWVTHEDGKKLDKPYEQELFGEDADPDATELADIVKTFRIHNDTDGKSAATSRVPLGPAVFQDDGDDPGSFAFEDSSKAPKSVIAFYEENDDEIQKYAQAAMSKWGDLSLDDIDDVLRDYNGEVAQTYAEIKYTGQGPGTRKGTKTPEAVTSDAKLFGEYSALHALKKQKEEAKKLARIDRRVEADLDARDN